MQLTIISLRMSKDKIFVINPTNDFDLVVNNLILDALSKFNTKSLISTLT